MSAPNLGGVSAPNFFGGGCLLQIFGGGWSAPNLGGCLLQILGGGCLQFSEYGKRSAGTHPTGMHSCFFFFFAIGLT